MPKVVIWANGYSDVFHGNQAAEARSMVAGTWSPQSQDFRRAAQRSGDVALPASTFGALLHQIGTRPAGSIDQLGIIAHSNESMIGLAGKIELVDGGNAEFFSSGTIDAGVLSSSASQIATIMDRFADGASITLFSCNTGSSLSLLIEFQTAFGLDCYGFKDEIWSCPVFTPPTHPTKIVDRGQMAYYVNEALTAQIDAGLVPKSTICSSYAKSSVWDLQPDMGFFSRN